MSESELVTVLVPKQHLAKVYGLIARLDDETVAPPQPQTPSDAGVVDGEWTQMRIRTAVQQSPPAMRDILQALATRPGEWLTTHDLAEAITGNPDADWKTVAGTLGAFGRRISSRYGLASLPFEGRYDHSAGCRVHRMTPEIARQVMQALTNGD